MSSEKIRAKAYSMIQIKAALGDFKIANFVKMFTEFSF